MTQSEEHAVIIGIDITKNPFTHEEHRYTKPRAEGERFFWDLVNVYGVDSSYAGHRIKLSLEDNRNGTWQEITLERGELCHSKE